MPAAQASSRTTPTPAPTATPTTKANKAGKVDAHVDPEAIVRLHITPFNPTLLPIYLAPSALPLATNISYHSVPTFPEKGFGYVELPAMEAQKLKKKLNGSTLKGSKVRIEDAKPEKRKAVEDGVEELDGEERKVKRSKKVKKEPGVLEGVELEQGRKIKRGWTEPAANSKKDRKEKKDKTSREQKASKYTKEPELLFKAKLEPVAATEVARKEKKDKKKDKKKSSKSEVVVHEFANNRKQPSFLKESKVTTEKKPAVEYVDGQGWVDEDGNVVEPETGKARNRRALELVDTSSSKDNMARSTASPQPTTEKVPSTTPEPQSTKLKSNFKPTKAAKAKKITPPPSSSSGSDPEESSAVSSSSGDEASESEAEVEAESSASSPALAPDAPQLAITPSSPATEKKEVHPLEALFKRPKPPALSSPSSAKDAPMSTPAKGLAPINTSFSFFGSDNADEVGQPVDGVPITPFMRQDIEWRGLRSAAPTPDTAAIGRRFSFPWRKGSQEADDDDDDDLEDDPQLMGNTKANEHPATIEEEDEDAEMGGDAEAEEGDANGTPVGVRRSARNAGKEDGEQSEFQKWFWENRGDNNRAWKKRRRDTLKANRLRENRKVTGGRRL
ncbi:hypothetical protein BDV96DRAFT_588379 [Lophiotrema nucula]|uniref:Uncharacterized protein n=1 Tax=Lophiotrema nucula TaxID=690887 RepID=A0A6A5YKY2_9PLEO|nr:hypothetical protein BDV96DRAFT_588379 [Lophiotrema nucula]